MNDLIIDAKSVYIWPVVCNLWKLIRSRVEMRDKRGIGSPIDGVGQADRPGVRWDERRNERRMRGRHQERWLSRRSDQLYITR